jgi:hypothetical protein
MNSNEKINDIVSLIGIDKSLQILRDYHEDELQKNECKSIIITIIREVIGLCELSSKTKGLINDNSLGEIISKTSRYFKCNLFMYYSLASDFNTVNDLVEDIYSRVK